MDKIKLEALLLILGILAATLNIIKTTLDIIEKIGAKKKDHERRKPRKQTRRK